MQVLATRPNFHGRWTRRARSDGRSSRATWCRRQTCSLILITSGRTLHAEATVRAVVAVPLLRRGAPVGAIAMGRNIPGEFSATQMELLKTFAEQAVIAITSAETYRALQTRTSDLQETLEYQTATSDVLKVISRSTFDLQPVLDTVVETAARLCDADQAVIYRREGESVALGGEFWVSAGIRGTLQSARAVSVRPSIAECRAQSRRANGRPVHIHDVAAVPGYPEARDQAGQAADLAWRAAAARR